MNANQTTAIFVFLAAASAFGAYRMRPVEVEPPAYEDTGEELFPEFTDPLTAESLTVTMWDDEASKTNTFQVELRDGQWVIPSHNGYPADATERMGKAAASFIGVRKDVVRSDDPKDHAQFGVQDPTDPDAKEKGRGIRVTLADASGTPTVDVIVGKDVPERPGFRFLRLPDQDRVYASRVKLDVSTKFTDWIEQDLLKVENSEIVAVVSNAYRVDENSGQVVQHDPLRFEKRKADESSPEKWTLLAPAPAPVPVADPSAPEAPPVPVSTELVPVPPPPGKEYDESKVRQIVSGIDRVRIVGVRPQPQPLTQGALLRKGFFLSEDLKTLFGNEGEVRAVTRDGITYRLYFGEITRETGLALTAGLDASSEADGADPAADDSKANRYMFVSVSYDEKLDQTKEAPPDLDPEGNPKPRGLARAKALRKRFDKWFYVVANSSFDQMHKVPADFLKDAKAK